MKNPKSLTSVCVLTTVAAILPLGCSASQQAIATEHFTTTPFPVVAESVQQIVGISQPGPNELRLTVRVAACWQAPTSRTVVLDVLNADGAQLHPGQFVGTGAISSKHTAVIRTISPEELAKMGCNRH